MIRKALRVLCAAMTLIFLFSGAVPAASAAENSPVNILLIGLDRRPGLAGCRSDTMVLCSYLPTDGTLTLVSFLRDLYLPIPGHGSNRLNAAYALGGRQLLCQTLEENFALKIDGCVEVDFNQFSDIVDALGGVEILLRSDEAQRINRYCAGSALTQGRQLLNGEQALCYSRIRDLDPDGDFSRTGRQRVILQAMLNRWKEASLTSMASAVGKLLPMVSTDLNPVQIMDWIFTAGPARKALHVESIHIPKPQSWQNQTIRGMDVIVCDIPENRAYLEENLGAN